MAEQKTTIKIKDGSKGVKIKDTGTNTHTSSSGGTHGGSGRSI